MKMNKLIVAALMTVVGSVAFAAETACVKELDLIISESGHSVGEQKLVAKCGGDAMINVDGLKVTWNGTSDLIVTYTESVALLDVPQSDGSMHKMPETVQRQIALTGPLPDSLTVPFGTKTLTVKTQWFTKKVAGDLNVTSDSKIGQIDKVLSTASVQVGKESIQLAKVERLNDAGARTICQQYVKSVESPSPDKHTVKIGEICG